MVPPLSSGTFSPLTNLIFGTSTYQWYLSSDASDTLRLATWCALALVSAIGVATNLVNILVLVQAEMIVSATNVLLLGLGVNDMLSCLEYLPYALTHVLWDLWDSCTRHSSYVHAAYVLVHSHLGQLLHTCTIGLTVSIAVCRWLAVCRPHLAMASLTVTAAKKVLAGIFVGVAILSAPFVMMYKVKKFQGPYTPCAGRTSSESVHGNASDVYTYYVVRLNENTLWPVSLDVRSKLK